MSLTAKHAEAAAHLSDFFESNAENLEQFEQMSPKEETSVRRLTCCYMQCGRKHTTWPVKDLNGL